jgi:hypothetical protein
MRSLSEKFKNWVFKPDKSYCSNVCDDIWGFSFSHACFVHDGYYRGKVRLPDKTLLKLQKANPDFYSYFHPTRLFADRRFYDLMRKEVKKQATSAIHRLIGELVAFRRYFGVRIFGWRFYSPGYDN